jgi:hypothetical protein
MRKNFMIAVLCAAICSCTKENPVPTDESVPLPWRVSGVTPQTSTYTAAKQADYTNPPPATTQCSKTSGGQSHDCKPIQIGCKKDTVVTPPPPEKDSCCR